MTKDRVDDLSQRRSRIDHHARPGDVLLGLVESDDQLPLGWVRAPLVVRTLVQPPVQRVEIDVEDEDLVAVVGCQYPYAMHGPDVVLVHGSSSERLASLGVALVGQPRSPSTAR